MLSIIDPLALCTRQCYNVGVMFQTQSISGSIRVADGQNYRVQRGEDDMRLSYVSQEGTPNANQPKYKIDTKLGKFVTDWSSIVKHEYGKVAYKNERQSVQQRCKQGPNKTQGQAPY